MKIVVPRFCLSFPARREEGGNGSDSFFESYALGLRAERKSIPAPLIRVGDGDKKEAGGISLSDSARRCVQDLL